MKLISARLYSDKRQNLLGSYCTNWLFVQANIRQRAGYT